MDSQKLKFMMSIQNEIDKLKVTLGETDPVVVDLVRQFSFLSGSELNNDIKDPDSLDLLPPIKTDTEAIRGHLGIKGAISINYDFIKTERVKSQLIKDNLKMENSRLDILIESETDRFHDFCVNAFFQIEELINYFFGTKYLFDDVKLMLRSKNPDKIYNQEHLSEINTADKLFIFEGLFYYNQYDSTGKKKYYESIINLIRDVRNESSHRCNIIERAEENIDSEYKRLKSKIYNYKLRNPNSFYEKTPEERTIERNGKILHFIKEKNYNLVRDTINDIASKIEIELAKT